MLLFVRSERNARRRLTEGASEVAREQTVKLPVVHIVWFAATLAEVWLMSRAVPHPPLLAAGGAMLVVGASLRVRDSRARGDDWTMRHFEGDEDNLGVRALQAELVGVPLLHGAALAAVLGWLMMAGYARGLKRVDDDS